MVARMGLDPSPGRHFPNPPSRYRHAVNLDPLRVQSFFSERAETDARTHSEA